MKDKTKKEYLSIAEHFYSTRMDGVPRTLENICGALLRCSTDYRPNYFRRLKLALAFEQNLQMLGWNAKEILAVNNPVTLLPEYFNKKKKLKRPKSIDDFEFYSICKGLRERNLNEEFAAVVLSFYTGARPAELRQIELNGNQIFIHGAKQLESGLRGLDRCLEVTDDRIIGQIDRAIQILSESARSMDAIRMSIRSAAVGILQRTKMVPSLYTFRHQMGSNLKASKMSALEIAYVMGHQSTASVYRYGDKRKGRPDLICIKPVSSADLSVIRVKTVTYRRPIQAPAKDLGAGKLKDEV